MGGLPKGRGLFTWRAEGGGSWAGNEARNTSKAYEFAKRASAHTDDMNRALMTLAFDPDGAVAVSALLKAGADPSFTAEDMHGATPLHASCNKGNTETIKVLVEHRADIKATWQGYTPLELALWQDRDGMVEELEALLLDVKETNAQSPATRRAAQSFVHRLYGLICLRATLRTAN